MNVSDWLAEAEARCAAATPGPWGYLDVGEGAICGGASNAGGICVCTFGVADEYDSVAGNPPDVADREFMLHARTDLPRALRLVRALLPIAEEARGQPHTFERMMDLLAEYDAAVAEIEAKP